MGLNLFLAIKLTLDANKYTDRRFPDKELYNIIFSALFLVNCY